MRSCACNVLIVSNTVELSANRPGSGPLPGSFVMVLTVGLSSAPSSPLSRCLFFVHRMNSIFARRFCGGVGVRRVKMKLLEGMRSFQSV